VRLVRAEARFVEQKALEATAILEARKRGLEIQLIVFAPAGRAGRGEAEQAAAWLASIGQAKAEA
jgi:hypothetical protein